jgi:hypothetical protein
MQYLRQRFWQGFCLEVICIPSCQSTKLSRIKAGLKVAYLTRCSPPLYAVEW